MSIKNTSITSELTSKNTGLYFQGKEIILGRKRGRPPARQYNTESGWFSQEKKIEACTFYAATGNAETVYELTGVPVGVIRNWRKEDWWEDILSQIEGENNDRIVAKMHNVIEKSLDNLAERLETGDVVYNSKTQEMVNVPVSARTLAQVVSTVTDKRQLVRGQPTSRVEKVSASDKLEKLAEKFLKFANAKEVTNEPEEAVG